MSFEEVLGAAGISGGAFSAIVCILFGIKWGKDNLGFSIKKKEERNGEYPTYENMRRYVAGELKEWWHDIKEEFERQEERTRHLDNKIDSNREYLSEKISDMTVKLSEKILNINR